MPAGTAPPVRHPRTLVRRRHRGQGSRTTFPLMVRDSAHLGAMGIGADVLYASEVAAIRAQAGGLSAAGSGSDG